MDDPVLESRVVSRVAVGGAGVGATAGTRPSSTVTLASVASASFSWANNLVPLFGCTVVSWSSWKTIAGTIREYPPLPDKLPPDWRLAIGPLRRIDPSGHSCPRISARPHRYRKAANRRGRRCDRARTRRGRFRIPRCPWPGSQGTATAQGGQTCGGWRLVVPAAGVREHRAEPRRRFASLCVRR